MSQTNLKTDDFCSYNQSAAPFYWTFEPYQYANTYVFGEVGVNSAGGSPGSYVRPDVIDTDSFLSGRDDILTRCNPPVPSLDDVKPQRIVKQDNQNVSLLVPKYTKEKKSAVDLSSIDYDRWQPNLPVEPQDLRFIIEAFAPQRGGMDTSNYSKSAWKPSRDRNAAVVPGLTNENACRTLLNPGRFCGKYCADVNGYDPNITGVLLKNRPPNEPHYPFLGPTSQDIKAVGATNCGENQFYGERYDKGSCGAQPVQKVLNHYYG